MATLLMRLAGPLQSWGCSSRYTIRDTGPSPTKSGVIGLICAALGKPRAESGGPWPALNELTALRMGVRVDAPGTVEREYQVAGGGTFLGRKYGVAKADNPGLEPLPSERFYLADATFLVGLAGDVPVLEQIDAALAAPVWQLALGRKGYVPGLPVCLPDGLRSTEGLHEALVSYPRLRPGPERLLFIWEVEDLADAEETRWDVPLDFENRRFGLRGLKSQFLPLQPLSQGR